MKNNNRLNDACEKGNMELVLSIIENDVNNICINYDNGLYYACKSGNMELVLLMIMKGGNNYNIGLIGACRNGHMEIVRLMIEKGANNYNNGLYEANLGGSIEIIRLMIEKCATVFNHRYKFPNDKDAVQTLLTSLPLKLFDKIDGYNQLVNIIKEREEYIINMMNNYIDHNINNFVLKEYILNLMIFF